VNGEAKPVILNEQELHQHLAAAADHASAPRFTIDDLTGRICRRRTRIIGLVSGSLLAVAAIAVAVPVALSGPSSPPTGDPGTIPFRLSFTVAVNGQSRVFPLNGSPPSITVLPGEHLRILVGVTVPGHAKVTTLWLGISKGVFTSPGQDGQRPASMRPVLAHSRRPLTSGLHTFRLTWTMPTELPRGTTVSLFAGWTTRQDYASVGQGVAELVTPR
jgi:hypothetical protein